jgi:L-2-amino-thiazoline-4-carboxylic acid hydrolase
MEIPIIERRRIEAEMLKLVHEELTSRLGAETAKEILTKVIRGSAIEQGKRFVSAEPGGTTTMASFVKLYDLWTMNGALEISVQRQDERHFDFNVTRCKYAEMYREMGLGELGRILSCNRDGTFCQGYDPKIRLERTQTIMEGAGCCDFRYEYQDAGSGTK